MIFNQRNVKCSFDDSLRMFEVIGGNVINSMLLLVIEEQDDCLYTIRKCFTLKYH